MGTKLWNSSITFGTEKISKKLCSCSQVEIRCSSENLKTLKEQWKWSRRNTAQISMKTNEILRWSRKRDCNGRSLNGNLKNQRWPWMNWNWTWKNEMRKIKSDWSSWRPRRCNWRGDWLNKMYLFHETTSFFFNCHQISMLENNFQKVSILARTFMSRVSLKKLLRDFPNEKVENFILYFSFESTNREPLHQHTQRNWQIPTV